MEFGLKNPKIRKRAAISVKLDMLGQHTSKNVLNDKMML